MSFLKFHQVNKWFTSIVVISILGLSLSMTTTGIVFAQVPDPQTPTETPASQPTDTPVPTQTETPAPTEISVQEVLPNWNIQINFPVSLADIEAVGGEEASLSRLVSTLDEILQGKGLLYQVQKLETSGEETVFQIAIQGSSSFDDFRQFVHSDLMPEFDLLNGPILLNITGDVIEGQAVTLFLQSRPTTGYDWRLSSEDTSLLSQIGEPEFIAQTDVLDSPVREVLHLQSAGTGTTTLQLVYRQPWQMNAPITRQVSMQLGSFADSIDLTSPEALVSLPVPQLESQEVLPMADGPLGLPVSFDRRTLGQVTAIRNQGGCGSCWAFATVGAMETAMLVQGGLSTDLSEQYLVSCNQSGYSCNGGWFAHEYHTNTYGKASNPPGAVLETAKTYTATDGTCTSVYNHPYVLSNWNYVSGSTWVDPTVEQIKTAIYNYGSVATTVCVAGSFGSYRSGVFTENNTCGGNPNHAVVLVGWNDADQTWIMRNSWGTSWGVSGYMNIRWGVSLIGKYSTYVVYQSSGTIPIAPGSLVATAASQTQINLNWQDNSSDESDFHIERSPNGSSSWVEIATVAAGTTIYNNTGLSAGTMYYYQVRAHRHGDGQYSNFSNTARATTQSGGSIANDDFGAELAIQGLPYNNTQTTIGATSTADDPVFSCVGFAGYNTVWYRYTPASTEQLTISTSGSNYDTVLGVWAGSRGALQNKACNDDYGGTYQSQVQVSLSAGVPYYIEVAGYFSSSSGNLVLSVQGNAAPVAPGNLVATAASQTQIDLSWQDNSSDETDFHIESSPDGTSGWEEIGFTIGSGTTSFSDTGAVCDIPNYYRVRAHRHSDGAYSTYSNIANATTSCSIPDEVTITSLSPNRVGMRTAGFTLTVNGDGFTANSVVQWNGANLVTDTSGSPDQVSAWVPANLIPIQLPRRATSLTINITVYDTSSDVTSNALPLTINKNPKPAITRMNPGSGVVYGPDVTLHVYGLNFSVNSQVSFNGKNLATQYISSTELVATVASSRFPTAKANTVRVYTPKEGGGYSGTLRFNSINPAPTLTDLAASVTTRSSTFSWPIYGSNFIKGAIVYWNGVKLSTKYVNSQTLIAKVPVKLVASSPTSTIYVTNKAPGGGASNTLIRYYTVTGLRAGTGLTATQH